MQQVTDDRLQALRNSWLYAVWFAIWRIDEEARVWVYERDRLDGETSVRVSIRRDDKRLSISCSVDDYQLQLSRLEPSAIGKIDGTKAAIKLGLRSGEKP